MNDHDTLDDSEASAAGPAEVAQAQQEVGLEAVETPTAQGEDLDALRQERDQLREQLLRRRAEFENFRRRVERERQGWAVDAQAQLLTELIPTLDHLDHALQAEGADDSLRDGVALIHRDLLATLARLGLEVHDPIGQPFDPSTQQALSREEAGAAETDTVVETYRRGFAFKDRLLRPALVRVAVAPTSHAGPASESPPDEVH